MSGWWGENWSELIDIHYICIINDIVIMLHLIKVDPRMGSADLNTIQDSLSFIMRSLEAINENTYSYSSISNGAETVLAIIASVVTIFGIVGLLVEYRERRVSKECQKRIILDLIRHMMVNNAIIEVVKSKVAANSSYRPQRGVFERFATLDSDVDLGRFSVNENNYEIIHNLSLKIRNYNSVVCVLDEYARNPSISPTLLDKGMDDVFYRAVEMSRKLLDLSQDLNIKITDDELYTYICVEKYGEKWVADQIKAGKYNSAFAVPVRVVSGRNHLQYYDKLNMSKTFDALIRHHSTRI